MHRKFIAILIATTAVGAMWGIGFASVRRPANQAARTSTATFAGGCFWSLEGAFRQLPGITDTEVGYTDGPTKGATHGVARSRPVDNLEACRVTFDPARITYERLVEYFLQIHSPPVADRKSPYVGSPAGLVIFFRDGEQERVAQAVKQRLQQPETARRAPIVDILPEGEFYRAEEYHQRYLEKNGMATCHIRP